MDGTGTATSHTAAPERPWIELDATSGTLADGFRAPSEVRIADVSRITRVGRGEIAGRLVLRCCARLAEIAPGLVTGGPRWLRRGSSATR